MKYEAEIRELLIKNAIRLIAEGGFEKATTKELTYCSGNLPNVKMNEVYIYRVFGSKENLYAAVFARLDDELFYAFQNAVSALGGFHENTKEKLSEFFRAAWRFILGNEDKCRCYVRYYYSIYFKGKSLETHKQRFADMIAEMTPLFKAEADVVSILHSVFTALFDFSIRVYNGELEDNDINRPHIFNVLYCMMATYFKETVTAP
ncbi:MAG: TetR/AcrR family transcriptional regulator [Clostridia bacterium]|nr:TetR/AcrR family transcriptional regulator [Clostridia bacterium]MBR7111924.1 TetR/AcrR family transcriptional regulator [Clostridia bacterium]